VALVSFWMVLLDWLRPGGLRPAPRVVASLVLGFAGLILLVGPAHLGGSERVNPTGAGILVIGSFAWAWGSIYSKHHDLPSSPLLGVAMLVPSVSAAASDFGWPLAWGGLGIMVRAAIAWYLAQLPAFSDSFGKK